MKILKFSSPTCSPCKKLDEYIKSISIPLDITSISMDKDIELFGQYKVRTVPTIIEIDEQGNEIDRWIGATSFMEFLNSLNYLTKE